MKIKDRMCGEIIENDRRFAEIHERKHKKAGDPDWDYTLGNRWVLVE